MKFYTEAGSPNALACLVTSVATGVKLQVIIVEKNGTQQKTPKNPLGKLPSLEVDQYSTFFETIAICRYLASKQVKIPLITEDDNGSQTDEWLEWVQTQFNPTLAKNGDASALFDKVEKAVTDKQFLVGTVVTLADIVVWSVLFAELKRNPSLAQKYPNIDKYVSTLAQEKNFATAIPQAKFAQ